MNALGHVGYVLLFAGIVLIANQNPAGWILRLSGEALWLFIGVRLGLSSIWFWGGVGIVVELYGFLSWT